MALRRITTARHGKPALSRDMLINWRAFGDWWEQYDLSGLHEDQTPPDRLKEIGAASDIVLSSTLRRARETARAVAGEAREIPARDLYVEAPLPAPPLPGFKLRPGQWGVVSRIYWFCGYTSGGCEGHVSAWRRAEKAARALGAAAEGGDVLLCAHGYFNWMIDKKLRNQGWRRTHDGGNNYWAWRSYEKDVETP